MTPRKALTKFEFAQLVLFQQGLCGCGCGDKLVFKPSQIRDEHLHQLSMGGTNELKNRSLWRLECTKAKDTKDAKVRAKNRSLTGATKKSQKAKVKIDSRPFQKQKKVWAKRKLNQPFVNNTRVDD